LNCIGELCEDLPRQLFISWLEIWIFEKIESKESKLIGNINHVIDDRELISPSNQKKGCYIIVFIS
jgi:hypothetical protein